MSKRWLTLTLTIFLSVGALALLFLLPHAAQSKRLIAQNGEGKFDPLLQEKMTAAPAETHFPVIVHLVQKSDLNMEPLPAGNALRRAVVVERLQATATSSQDPLLPFLDQLQAAGTISAYESFWIFNGFALAADAPALAALAARPEVARIVYDADVRIEHDPVIEPAGNLQGLSDSTWGLQRVQAPQAWYGLGIKGEGVTVGILDSGVDWLHPALRPNYRGQLPNGSLNHVGNWFDALDHTNVTPVDPFGHGTHVAGTVVGLENLGVAPGAKWIAVRTFDVLGQSTFSTIHSAFEWFLAPAGNSSLAPDIVNNSWSSGADIDEFLDDIAAFKAAGILLVFSAGNNGNEPGTLGTPAAYTDTLAVGALDEREQWTWFSSAGPSLFTGRNKPEIIAPGARVLSTLPDNQYGYSNGTSMSAPHVSGAAALLLAADSTLTPPALTRILTETAQPFAATHPNPQSGWGVLNVYQALAPQVATGSVSGTVRMGNQVLAGVTITVDGPAGIPVTFFTDDAGQYSIDLVPGAYDIQFAAFGMHPADLAGLNIAVGSHLVRDVSLIPFPAGTIQGIIQEQTSNRGLEALVRVAGAPVTTTANSQGEYTLSLPAGTYDIHVSHTGHRLQQTTVIVPAGGTVTRNFTLTATDRVLLVDSGWWYYNSQAAYYRQGLAALGMAHDEWPIYNPFLGRPDLEDLTEYDAVLWSAPADSPGVIGAGHVISQYLGTGGNLFISGSSIGSNDGHITPEAWWFIALRAMYVTSLRPVGTPPVFGEPETPFAGLDITLNGGDSAGNQIFVDQVAPVSGSFTAQGFNYGEARGAGLVRGKCVSADFNVVYLGFGLEGVSSATDRREILARSFDFFHEPPQTAGVKISPEFVYDFAIPGRTLTLTMEVLNESETITDTFQLNLQNSPWPAQLITPTLEIGPCKTGRTHITVDVPADVPEDTTYDFLFKATSTSSGLQDEAAISLKTPGTILFVNDYRFFDETAAYVSALDSLGVRYDVWETGWSGSGRGSPGEHVLSAYDIVLWYTGYDWFEPVSTAEADALAGYLAGGGRLFLSSQDYLYYHDDHSLTATYLGVEGYMESVTPTLAYGGPDLLLGDVGPYALVFEPYQNNSDGLRGTARSQPFLMHNGGGTAGLANAGVSPVGSHWRTVFWAMPWEKLPEPAQEPAMNRILGQLGDLGDSTWEVSARSPQPGQTLYYTLTLHNHSAGEAGVVSIMNTLPPELILDESSLAGGATYDPATRLISWGGDMADGAEQRISYQARIEDAAATEGAIHNEVALHYARHDFTHTLTSISWIGAPDMQGSALLVSANPLPAGRGVTYTLLLLNTGAAGQISATAGLPAQLFPLTDTVNSSAGTAFFRKDKLSWEGTIPAGETVTVTMMMTSAWKARPYWYATNLVIDDGMTVPQARSIWLNVTPFQIFQPAIFYEIDPG